MEYSVETSLEDLHTVEPFSVAEEELAETINIDLSFEARKASVDDSGMFGVGSGVNGYLLSVLDNNSTTYQLFLKYG